MGSDPTSTDSKPNTQCSKEKSPDSEQECPDSGPKNRRSKLKDWWFSEDPGLVRLEGELGAFEAESAYYINKAKEKEPGIHSAHENLIRKAKCALRNNKVEQGWNYLHAAERIEIRARGQTTDSALRPVALAIYKESNHLLGEWRKEAIECLLLDENNNKLRNDLDSPCVEQAHWILYEQYQRLHLKRRYLQDQFNLLLRFSVLFIAVFLALSIALNYLGVFPSPFSNPTTDRVGEIPFALYVLLSGAIGATLFGLRSLQNQEPLSPNTAQHITSLSATLARIAIGAVAALVIYLFVTSGIVMIGPSPLSAQGILAISFAAGYSERLAPQALESISANPSVR